MRPGLERDEAGRAHQVVLRLPVRGCLWGAAFLLVSACALAVAVLRIDRFLTDVDGPAPADAIVVLVPGAHRTERAVALFRQGYAPVVVTSEDTLANAGLACSGAALQRTDAEAMGLPAGALIVAGEAESTYDEAQNVRRLVEERGWRSLIVVTDPLHTRRAGRTFSASMPETAIHVVAAPNPRYDPQHWWRSEDGMMAVFSEGVKMGIYWARYGIAPLGK